MYTLSATGFETWQPKQISGDQVATRIELVTFC